MVIPKPCHKSKNKVWVSQKNKFYIHRIKHNFLLKEELKKKMASVVTKYAPKLKFQYQDFEIMNIPNLMINIWSYSDDHGRYCNICRTYKNWCIKVLKKNGSKHTWMLLLS